jgi:hypothetical protein
METMKRRMLLALAGLAAGLIAPAFSQDEVTPEIRQQIEALNQKLDGAINNHDPAGCAACCIANRGGGYTGRYLCGPTGNREMLCWSLSALWHAVTPSRQNRPPVQFLLGSLRACNMQ